MEPKLECETFGESIVLLDLCTTMANDHLFAHFTGNGKAQLGEKISSMRSEIDCLINTLRKKEDRGGQVGRLVGENKWSWPLGVRWSTVYCCSKQISTRKVQFEN